MRLSFIYADYKFAKFLGQGSFGTVFKAYKRAGSGQYAAKVMWHEKVNKMDIQSEIDALKELNHPNIVKLYEIIYTPTQTCLIQEYCGTSLWDAAPLYKNNGPRIKNIFAQMVSALYYIHEKGYVHRDISPGNVLLSGKNMDKVTIIDLGMTKPFATDGEIDHLRSVCGTKGFAAPEMAYTTTHYEGVSMDLWSCGAILHYLVFIAEPFASLDDYYKTPGDLPVLLTEKRSDITYFDGYDSAAHLMKKMLPKLPKNRYTWSDVINHSWLQEYRVFFAGQSIPPSESQSKAISKNEKHVPSEITMDESISNAIVKKMMQESVYFNNGHNATESRMNRIINEEQDNEPNSFVTKEIERGIKRLLFQNQANLSEPTSADFILPAVDNLPHDDLREPKNYDDAGAFTQAPPAGQILPNPKDIFRKVKNNVPFNPFGPVHPPNKNNGPPNRIAHFFDDAVAPYTQLLDDDAPFYGPTANLVPSPVEKNALVKRKPVPVAKNKVSSIIVLSRPDANQVPFKADSIDLVDTITLDNGGDMPGFAPPFENKASSNVDTSESAPLFENKALSSSDTSEFAANELLYKDEALASVENKALSNHVKPSLKKDLPPSDHVTPASVCLKSSNLKVTALSPHKGKISLRTITTISPDKMLRSIKKVLINMGIPSHMSGYQKMKCLRPQCEESSIIARIQNAISSLLLNDQGKDIRFTIQLNRLDKVPGFYVVNIKRLQGNKTAFKVLRKEILDSLNLYD